MIKKGFTNIFILWIISGSCISQPREQLSDMTKEQLLEYRLYYINNFERIGLNTTAGDARLLRILVESSGAKRGVEVGSATGFGAIHMGMGFEVNEGELFTIDIDPQMIKTTQEHVNNMGLNENVTCMEGDALKVIPELTGEFDFVFIDAQKSDYYSYFKAIEPRLAKNAIIVADNVIRFKSAMKDFLNDMEKSLQYDMQIIQASEEKSDGMAVIYKKW